jgi:glycosyltransferase involved in cell wall biosynthesis
MSGMRHPSLLYLEPLGIEGGMGHYNDALISAYADLGCDIEIVTNSASELLGSVASVATSRMFRVAFDRKVAKPIRGLAYASGLTAALWRARGKDAVIVHFLHRPSIDYWMLRSLRAIRVPIVLIAHDPHPVLPTQGGRWYHASLAQVSLFVVHGPAAQRDLLKLLRKPAEIIVAPFGEFRAVQRLAPDVARRELALGPLEPPVGLIVGNLKPGKGIETAVARVGAPGSPIRSLLVAGRAQGGWDVEGALALPPDSPIAIHRVDRRMTDEQELAAYSLADLVLCLYESGYSSGVIARAHAVGRPVVITDVGDLAGQIGGGDAIVAADYSTADVHDAIGSVLAGRSGQPAPATTRWTDHAASVVRWLTDGMGVTARGSGGD